MSDPLAKTNHSPAESVGRFRFRIVHILYVIAVVASSLATFGIGGLVPAIVIIGFWATVFSVPVRWKALGAGCLFLIVAFCLLCCLLIPAVQTAREAARRTMCVGNLKQIALALHNYHDVYDCFPPAYVADQDGKPMHSWRVLILPFIEERTLYEQYDFSEPWDGPNNRKLLPKMPDTYACPSLPLRTDTRRSCTSYVAVVDPRTAWPGAQPRKIADIADGTSNTILILELGSQGIPWMEPRDPSLSEALSTVRSVDFDAAGGHVTEDFFYRYYRGRNVAMTDGAVIFISPSLPEDQWANLLTIDDRTVGPDDWVDWASAQVRKPRLDNWFRLGLFVLIALFPVPWVWIRPRSPERENA